MRQKEDFRMETMRVKLNDEKTARIFGGGNDVLDHCSGHNWVYTGREDEGWFFFFWTKHEKEQKCTKCGSTRWIYED